MTKLKLKKKFKLSIIIIIFLTILSIIGYKGYQEYKYRQTYEYKLLQIGYNLDETKLLINNFDNTYLDYFLTIEKDETTLSLLNEKYYINKNYERYKTYLKENSKATINDAIIMVNTNNDLPLYETEFDTDLNKNYLMLVNKYYKVNQDYNPDDLTTISSNYSWGEIGSQKIKKIAYDAFLNMWEDASSNGIYLMVNSSFRQYNVQENIYNNYKNTKGERYADSYAARAGHSEHQTGLALDIFSKENPQKATFKDSNAYNYLKDNSYKFGFILRYPEGKEEITGYSFESWHYRYVGVDVATYIYENSITFDEYYAYFLDK